MASAPSIAAEHAPLSVQYTSHFPVPHVIAPEHESAPLQFTETSVAFAASISPQAPANEQNTEHGTPFGQWIFAGQAPATAQLNWHAPATHAPPASVHGAHVTSFGPHVGPPPPPPVPPVEAPPPPRPPLDVVPPLDVAPPLDVVPPPVDAPPPPVDPLEPPVAVLPAELVVVVGPAAPAPSNGPASRRHPPTKTLHAPTIPSCKTVRARIA